MYQQTKHSIGERESGYHQAMKSYPLARHEEFGQMVQWADIQPGQTVGDFISAGGYLDKYIDSSVKVISVEASEDYAQLASENNGAETTLLCKNIGQIPLPSGSLDRAICLAGTHHLPDKLALYRETYRLLKTGSIFCVADVLANSDVDRFLDIFVDQHSTKGHQGVFFDENTLRDLESVGFQIDHHQTIQYHWKFDSLNSMVHFCRLLFRINRASDEEILNGIKNYLGYQTIKDQYLMNWGLYFFRAIK